MSSMEQVAIAQEDLKVCNISLRHTKQLRLLSIEMCRILFLMYQLLFQAFERRLTEIIAEAQPSAMIWRVILIFASLCVAVGACYWLGDPTTAEVALMVSLMNHPFFSLSAVAIGMLKIRNKTL